MIMCTESEQRVKTLFLQPEESYGLPYVARLAEMPERTLRREVADGRRDGLKVRGAWRFTWRQTVSLTMERWTLAEIHYALGLDAAKVLPPLLSLRAVTIRLPEYIVRALEVVAVENETTLDDAVHGELIDFAGTLSGRMEAYAPGYQRAYLFPGQE
jgi:hypothetical protein